MIEDKLTPYATWLRSKNIQFRHQYSDKRKKWRRIKFFDVTSPLLIDNDDYEFIWPSLQQEALSYYKAKHPSSDVIVQMIREIKPTGNIYSIIITVYYQLVMEEIE